MDVIINENDLELHNWKMILDENRIREMKIGKFDRMVEFEIEWLNSRSKWIKWETKPLRECNGEKMTSFELLSITHRFRPSLFHFFY
jgi:hypothetical protein